LYYLQGGAFVVSGRKVVAKPTVVIGLGNLLLSDEGIGVHLINALAPRSAEFPAVDFVDLGAGGLAVVHALAGRKKALLLDCAFMHEPAGTLRKFRPDEVQSVKALSGFSLHEGDLLKLLELSRQLEDAPAQVIIFGIQPADTSPGREISQVLANRLNYYLQEIIAELQENSSA
jgi:hydrogenase maturation protease